MRKKTLQNIIYTLLILIGLGSALPNVLPNSVLEDLPDWYSQNQFVQGLDLQGGSHLLMEVVTEELLVAKNQSLAEEVSQQFSDAKINVGDRRVTKNAVTLKNINQGDLSRGGNIAQNIVNHITSSSDAYIVRTADKSIIISMQNSYKESLIHDAVKRSVDVVRNRLDETGIVEPSVTRQGSHNILIQLPGVDNPDRIRELLGTTGRMTFHWVLPRSSSNMNSFMLPGGTNDHQYILEKAVAMEGEHISDARLGFDQQTNAPVVNFRLDSKGTKRFAALTKHNVGKQLAIVLDEKVITAPVIRDTIAGGRGEISGSFTSVEASDTALLLRAGSLPAPLHVIEERTVGAELGDDAINMGITTGAIGAMLVLACMFAIYGRWGFIACLGLSINIGLIFGILSFLGATLTLPGIAGLILGLGMAVDAIILINERIREEIKKGKSALAAFHGGFKYAFNTILDSNITTFIAVSFLFLFGEGPIRGFAITMAVGLFTSMFTALSIMRSLMEWRARKTGKTSLGIDNLLWLDKLSDHSKPIDFMRRKGMGFLIACLLGFCSLGLIVNPGLDYGIDFEGGIIIEAKVPNAEVEDIRKAIKGTLRQNVLIQQIGNEAHYTIRVPASADTSLVDMSSGEKTVSQKVKSSILTLSENTSFLRTEMVGPKVSGDFAETSVSAVLLAGIGMLLYLGFRFETHFAIAAISTIALDLVLTLGFFALTGIEFNLTAVAALLALIGYSINDKVVVFDRIRENLKLTPDKPLLELFNQSISTTLSRTVLTSFTTILAILPMVIAGGSAVKSFAHPMLFSIVIGTTSSIFVASPILLWLGKRRIEKGLAQLDSKTEEIKKMEESP